MLALDVTPTCFPQASGGHGRALSNSRTDATRELASSLANAQFNWGTARVLRHCATVFSGDTARLQGSRSWILGATET